MREVVSDWPDLSESIAKIYDAFVDHDITVIQGMGNVLSVYDLELIVSSISKYSIDFGPRPRDFLNYIIVGVVPEGIGVEVPFWDINNKITDVYFEVWAEKSKNNETLIYLKGHCVL